MADNCIVAGRISTKDTYVTYEPCGDPAAQHTVLIRFQGTATPAGTFKLWVDGQITAAITYDALVATLVTNIQTALDAIAPATFTVTAVGSLAEIEADAVGYHRIIAMKDTMNVKPIAQVTLQGTETFELAADLSALSFTIDVDVTDVTAMGEYARTSIPVAEMVDCELSLYAANKETDWVLYSGGSGVLTVWDEGQITDGLYQQFMFLITSIGKEYPDKEKIEYTISGERQGEWYVPPGTRYVAP